MLQPGRQARRPSSGGVQGGVPGGGGLASRLFPTLYAAPSVTAVAVASAATAQAHDSRRTPARDGGDAARPRAVRAAGAAPVVRPQSSAAFSRLYAHAVDLMEHKDDVFRHFGLHKEERRAAVSAPSVGARRPTATAPAPAKPRSLDSSRRSSSDSSSRRRSSSSGSRQPARPGGRGHVYGRSSSAASLTSRRAPAAALARTFSLQSTLASRAAVSPHPRTQREPKASASSSSSRTGSSTARANKKQLQSSTTARSTAKGASARQLGPKRRPSEREKDAGAAATAATQPPQRLVRRQSSFPVLGAASAAAAAACIGQQQQSLVRGARAPQRKASVAGARQLLSPPVMVEVSRRTSAPMSVAVSGAGPGLRRRPSVARIPSAAGGGPFRAEDAPQGALPPPQALGPRASAVFRRDAKLERLMEQVSVLKASLGLSDEDLQWKVESARGNAFLAAERRLGECEERYDRLEYEARQLARTPCDEASAALLRTLRALAQQAAAVAEAKPRLAARQADMAQSRQQLAATRVQSEAGAETETDAETDAEAEARLEEANAGLLDAQEQLRGELERLNGLLLALAAETDALAAACTGFCFTSPEAAAASAALVALLRSVPECSGGGERLVTLCEQATQATQRLTGSRAKDLRAKQQELERTLRDVEVWKARRDAAPEFAAEMAARERQWRAANAAENAASLRLLRALVPADVQQLSVDAMVARAEREAGVLLPRDLAAYVKHNRLLHWLVAHESDVARDNFLSAESAPSFMNLAALDVVELRAVTAVLPAAFELDKDGRKAAWRAAFLEHAQALVRQQRGERVAAGWDPARGGRAEAALQPLTDRQALNPVYRYPTDAEIQARLDRFELQRRRLALKRDTLLELERDKLPAAKAEYLAIAEDARCEDLQRRFGRATISRLRDDAKRQLAALGAARDALQAEVRHAEAAWAALSPSLEQFQDEAAKVRLLPPEVRAARVRGPFPADLEPQPRARAAFKKLSVEDEAQARRQELDSAIARRSLDMDADQQPTADGALHVRQPSQPDAVAAKEPAKAVGDTDGDAAEPAGESVELVDAPTQPIQKVRSLRVAANVLRFLEQDFCSPARIQAAAASRSATSTPARRLPPTSQAGARSGDAAASTATEKATVTAAAAPPAPCTPGLSRPKSKTLLLLLEKEAEAEAAARSATGELTDAEAAVVAEPSSAPPGGRPDFLGELQRRTNRPRPAGGETATPTARPAVPSPPKSFLDELKRKALGRPAVDPQPSGLKTTPTTSFLAELRAKAARE